MRIPCSLGPRSSALCVTLGLTLAAVVAGLAVAVGVQLTVETAGLRYSPLLRTVLRTQVQYGFLAVALGYLALSAEPSRYARFHVPSTGDLGWLLALLALVPVTSAPRPDYFLTEALRTTPALWVVVFVCWFLVTAPAEELLFRGVIQTRLDEAFRAPVAVALAAALFALMHVAFAANQGGGGLASRAVVTFVMGGVFGVVYQRTENLVVPAVGHATYWLSPALLVYVP